MMRQKRLWTASAGLVFATSSLSCAVQAPEDPARDDGAATADATAHRGSHRGTRTPIQHAIIVVGENLSFDNLFGTY